MHREHDVELVSRYPGDQVPAQLASHIECDIRVVLGEPAEELRQEREGEIAGDADADRPGQDAAVQATAALVVQRYNLLGVFEDDLALRRQSEGLARVGEDRRAHDVLKAPRDEKSLDAVILTSLHNVLYYTGFFCPPFGQLHSAVVPGGGEPALIVSLIEDVRPRHCCYYEDIRPFHD